TYVQQLLAAAAGNRVPCEAIIRRDILKPAFDSLTAEQCRDELAKIWGRGELSVYTTGKLDLGDDSEKVLSAVYEKSRTRLVNAGPPDDTTTGGWMYSSARHARGPMAHLDYVSDIAKLSGRSPMQIEFENGVKLNLMHSTKPLRLVA